MGNNGKSKSNIFSRYIVWLVILAVLAVLFATNPTESKFKEFLTEKVRTENKIDDPVESWITEIVSGTSARIEGLTTNRKEYYLFSTYEIGLSGNRKLYLGMLDHFILIVQKKTK